MFQKGVNIMDFETSYTNEIICPYCGYEFSDSIEIENGNNDVGEVDCSRCEKTFITYRNVEVTYNTWKKEDDKK